MTKRANTQVTLREFKAWLEGVEELQAKSWVPDASQWKLIRKKINKIVETSPTQQNDTHPQAYNTPQHVGYNSALPPGVPPMPQIASSIPLGEVELGETAKAVGLEQKTAPDGSIVLKTPDSSSTDGSQFS